jgi:hypothetical protein
MSAAMERLLADDKLLADLTQEYQTLRVNGVRMDYTAWVQSKLAPVFADLDVACRAGIGSVASRSAGVPGTFCC